MMRFLRWFAVVPAAIAGWYLALLVGLLLFGIARRLCPPEAVLSGACTAPWFNPVETGLVYFGAGLAAVLVMVFATVAAPSHRLRVATAAFGLGTVLAGWMAWQADAWGEAVVAVLAGGATLLLLRKKIRPHPIPDE